MRIKLSDSIHKLDNDIAFYLHFNMEQKYKQIRDFFGLNDIPEKYNSATWFEKCVLLLRLNGFSYGNIQLRLGNPPKKEIREVLLKWAPELIDIDLNKPNVW